MLTSSMLFMNLQCKNGSTKNMKMNFNSSYNFICLQKFIQTNLEQQNSSIKSSQIIKNELLKHVSLIHLDINIYQIGWTTVDAFSGLTHECARSRGYHKSTR
jgi:hypothetical protein